jgi:hypothetical protein
MSKFPAPANAGWFDPTSNSFTDIGGFANSGKQRFTPRGPNGAGDGDWLLLMEAE